MRVYQFRHVGLQNKHCMLFQKDVNSCENKYVGDEVIYKVAWLGESHNPPLH